MKLARFIYKNKINWGVVDKDNIKPLKQAPFEGIVLSKSSIPLSSVKLLAPATPTKIILCGLNYKDHAKELSMPIPDEPVIFLKPCTCLIACREVIKYPSCVSRLDYEGELAFVISKNAYSVRESKALDYILGYTCLNDVTARDLQRKDVQWTRAKSFDTFCPLGPWLETDINPAELKIRTLLNGKTVQDSNTSNLIFPVQYLVSFISNIMTLYPGDIISTGTPFGVGPMQPKDTVEVEIEGIGRLVNRVVKRGAIPLRAA